MRAFKKSFKMAVFPGQAGAVIKLPSTTVSSGFLSIKTPPAITTSGLTAG
ncbi:hypothetical protein DE151_001059 [Clostridium beijerinckii]|nr:hypothetical protein [Clostridium beijerinckii]